MKHNPIIEISKERRALMISDIKHFFETEREETIGDLASEILLDFIIEKFGSEFYNQGVYDSHTYIAESAEDLLSILK